MPTPGLASLAALEAVPRGQLEFNGRLFVVAGTKLYEISLVSLGAPGIPIQISTTVRGSGLANDGLPASLAASQTQLLIASAGSVYLLVLATNAFSQVAASNFTLSTGPAPVKQVEFCDSFFLALIANSQTVCISNVLDGSAWNLNGQIVVSVYPENIVSMKVDHRELWLFGKKKTVIYSASGSISVFDVQPGGFVEQGSAATFACDKLDNSIFWLGGDDRGDAIAWRATGYNAQRISTHATEYAWQNYTKRSDAVSYTYQRFGHAFWVVLFPSANGGNGATWVYDTASGLWHERDFLNVTTGYSMGHPSWNHTFWNGTHIVGDWRSANLYQMDDQFFDNAGVPIVRVRRAPPVSTELETIKHTRFILDMETVASALGQAPVILQSPNGNLWQLGTIDTPALTTTRVNTGTVQVIKLTDPTKATSWLIGVNNAGMLTTTSITLDLTLPLAFLVLSYSRITAWNMQVNAGGLLQIPTVKVPLPTLQLNNGQGPFVYLRFSDDGGHTWSNAQPRAGGATGQYKTRVVWRRLGRARIRTYEISCSEPVPIRIVDAYINAAPGFAPTERLPHSLRKVA